MELRRKCELAIIMSLSQDVLVATANSIVFIEFYLYLHDLCFFLFLCVFCCMFLCVLCVYGQVPEIKLMMMMMMMMISCI